MILRVLCEERAWCLRGWPPHALPPARLTGLHRLVQHLASAGLPVAVPRRSAAGEMLIAAGDRLWQLEPWLPGTADYLQQPTRARLRAALGGLAAWHHRAAAFDCRPAEAAWFRTLPAAPSPGLRERHELLDRWRSRDAASLRDAALRRDPCQCGALLARVLDLALRWGSVIQREIESVASASVPCLPVLRDVWHDHLLFTGDELTGLIDYGACRTESVAADLARLLGSLHGDDLAAWGDALDLYQQVRPLSLAETRLVPVFDRSGVLLSGLTWVDWLLTDARTFTDPVRVRTRLAGIVDRLQAWN